MADALDSFEEAAEAFHKVTGNLMPGKDGCPRDEEGNLLPEVARDHRVWCAAIQYMHRETGALQKLERELSQAKADLAKATNCLSLIEQTDGKAREVVKDLLGMNPDAGERMWYETAQRLMGENADLKARAKAQSPSLKTEEHMSVLESRCRWLEARAERAEAALRQLQDAVVNPSRPPALTPPQSEKPRSKVLTGMDLAHAEAVAENGHRENHAGYGCTFCGSFWNPTGWGSEWHKPGCAKVEPQATAGKECLHDGKPCGGIVWPMPKPEGRGEGA